MSEEFGFSGLPHMDRKDMSDQDLWDRLHEHCGYCGRHGKWCGPMPARKRTAPPPQTEVLTAEMLRRIKGKLDQAAPPPADGLYRIEKAPLTLGQLREMPESTPGASPPKRIALEAVQD